MTPCDRDSRERPAPLPLRVVCMHCGETITPGRLDRYGRYSSAECAKCAPPPLYTDRQCRECGARMEPGNIPWPTCDGCRETSRRNEMEGKR